MVARRPAVNGPGGIECDQAFSAWGECELGRLLEFGGEIRERALGGRVKEPNMAVGIDRSEDLAKLFRLDTGNWSLQRGELANVREMQLVVAVSHREPLGDSPRAVANQE